MKRTACPQSPPASGLGMILCILCLATIVPAQVTSRVETKKIYPGADAYHKKVIVTQIVDSSTGLPIPGATMSLVEEADFPLAGFFTCLRSTIADQHGWVRIELGSDPGFKFHWIYFDAPGYAPRAEMYQYAEFPIELHRGEDRAFRVIDRLGRPQAGLNVGLIIGCGHTPDVRNTVTDGAGIGVFKDVSRMVDIADVWVDHPSFHAVYLDWRDVYSPDPRGEIELDWGHGVIGSIVDPDGNPVAGAFVGLSNLHRGPWAKTDENGAFRLAGLDESGARLCVIRPGTTEQYLPDEVNLFPQPPKGVPCTIVLHPDGRVQTVKQAKKLTVRLVDGEEAVAADGLAAVRTKDGLSCWARVEEDEPAVLKIGQGDTWQLIYHDPQLRFQDKAHTITKSDLEKGEVVLRLQRHNAVEIQLDTRIDQFPSEISLVVEGREASLVGQFEFQEDPKGEKPADGYERFIGKIPVPAQGPAVIRVDWDESEDSYSHIYGVDTVERFHIPADRSPMKIMAPAHVPFRIKKMQAPDGTPVKAEVSFLPRRAVDEIIDYGLYPEEKTFKQQHEFALPVGAALWAFVKPLNNSFEPQWIYIPKIRRGDPPIETGVLTFKKSDELHVHFDLPDGGPAKEAAGRLEPESGFTTDKEGDWWPEQHTESDLMGKSIGPVTIESEWSDASVVPLRTRLLGRSPWQISWPKGVVKLNFSFPKEEDEDGNPIAPSVDVLMGGHEFGFHLDPASPTVSLEGISPGTHRMIVTSPSCLTHEIEFTMKSGTLKIPVALTLRQE